jgi:hypothetical protein
MNTTSFIGRLTKDPEVHATASGPVADMRSRRKLQQMKEGSSMTHANHEINPGFDPRQIWKDGCTECGNRSRLLPMSILEGQVVQLGPRSGRVGLPTPKKDTMYGGDVPAGCHPHPGAYERYRCLVRPPHPSGTECVLDQAHDNRGVLRPGRPGEGTGGGRHPEPDARRVGQPDQVPPLGTRTAELVHHLRVGHRHHLVTPPVPPAAG